MFKLSRFSIPQVTTDGGGTETEQFEASEISEVVDALDHPVETIITNGEETAEATNVHREAEEAGTSEGAMVEMDIGDGDGTVCMVDENGVLQKVTQQECKNPFICFINDFKFLIC